MTSKNPVYVFDLDGVITEPANSVVDQKTIEHIHSLLENNHLVAINTGRSYAWVKENLLSALEGLGGQTFFSDILVVCEKGGESTQWQTDRFVAQPSRFALPEAIQQRSKQIFEENAERLSSMFWDGTKLTMATIEKRPEADLAQFKMEQEVLAGLLEEAFAGQNVRVDATTIATDIESVEAGKHAGAELIFEWVTAKNGTPAQSFVSFGDSKSDYEMARYFAAQGSESTFVFVGIKETVFEEAANVALVRTNTAYAAGTREYFEQ